MGKQQFRGLTLQSNGRRDVVQKESRGLNTPDTRTVKMEKLRKKRAN